MKKKSKRKKDEDFKEYFKGYKITLEFVETEEDREFREIRTHNIKQIVSQVYRSEWRRHHELFI